MGFFSECVVGCVGVCAVYFRGFIHLVKLRVSWVVLGGLGDFNWQGRGVSRQVMGGLGGGV